MPWSPIQAIAVASFHFPVHGALSLALCEDMSFILNSSISANILASVARISMWLR